MFLFFDIFAKAFHIEPARSEQEINQERQRIQARRQRRQEAEAACRAH